MQKKNSVATRWWVCHDFGVVCLFFCFFTFLHSSSVINCTSSLCFGSIFSNCLSCVVTFALECCRHVTNRKMLICAPLATVMIVWQSCDNLRSNENGQSHSQQPSGKHRSWEKKKKYNWKAKTSLWLLWSLGYRWMDLYLGYRKKKLKSCRQQWQSASN